MATLLDTKGPEIRLGLLQGGKAVTLNAGDTFTLTTRRRGRGQRACASISYPRPARRRAGRAAASSSTTASSTWRSRRSPATDIVLYGASTAARSPTSKGVNVPGVQPVHALLERTGTGRTSSSASRPALTSSPPPSPARAERHAGDPPAC